ncbi:MAG: NAD(P)/FAD-dependent oxidoreductase [Bryobacterales bacterium]|nr:NAD(P)/FAD-dependent oxidoreductase [Bryobacterales bacterium]
MDGCDVLIVGGGPAGSTCAWRLRDSGLEVRIVDKEAFPRDKVCGGWVTPAVFTTLGVSPEEYRQGRVMQPVSRFLTSILGGPAFETTYPETVSYGVWRREFDDFLLRRSGARVDESCSIRSMKRSNGAWLVNGELQCRVLVGAGGHFCPVARHLGSRPSMERAVTAQEAEWEMDPVTAHACSVRGNTPELYFSPDLHGYGWCFRKSLRLNVGYGHLAQESVCHQVEEFRTYLETRRCIGAVLPARFRGHAYLLRTTSARPLASDGALLVGDAAGLAFPSSGEGILPAIESGLLAAEAILAAKGDYRASRLAAYATALEQRLGPREPSRLTRAAEALPHPVFRALVTRLMRNRGFVNNHLLSQWFLHQNREAMVLTG